MQYISICVFIKILYKKIIFLKKYWYQPVFDKKLGINVVYYNENIEKECDIRGDIDD